MASNQSGQTGQSVDLTTLAPQQLMQLKKQLDDELDHLNNSYNALRSAQAKFTECQKVIEGGVKSRDEGAPLLVPLTTSLYVPGTLSNKEKVIVDVGTGFYVEKTTEDATKFYDTKIKELSENLKDLERILEGKSNNLRVVEEVLRQKVAQGQSSGQPIAAS